MVLFVFVFPMKQKFNYERLELLRKPLNGGTTIFVRHKVTYLCSY